MSVDKNGKGIAFFLCACIFIVHALLRARRFFFFFRTTSLLTIQTSTNSKVVLAQGTLFQAQGLISFLILFFDLSF